jgi:hypothetical protein
MTKPDFEQLEIAARDTRPVSGLTHNFYRYPARFSPSFARAAIDAFSQPGDRIADPYMGGGTAVVEGAVTGRDVVGNDLNSLAAFVSRVKTTPLRSLELDAVREWAIHDVSTISYRAAGRRVADYTDDPRTKNLSLDRARFLKKAIAAALASIEKLPTRNAQDFARCAVLRVAQWALDGRRAHTSVADFKVKLIAVSDEMLTAIRIVSSEIKRSGGRVTILNMDAANLHNAPTFRHGDKKISLVVTSPPYPGVHVLYHRWQVDGRRETPAPYWITGCSDGQGAAFYNFGDRRYTAADDYFERSLRTLVSVRGVMRDGGHMVQLVAFSRPDEQLPRYLDNMKSAGFTELLGPDSRRIWRDVPNRKWHATLRGGTNGAKEVVLIHRAD